MRSHINRWMKKLRRRKGLNVPKKPSADMTAAEELIMSNWGIRFDFTPAKRAGEERAEARLKKQRKFQGDVKSTMGVSRQVARAKHRRDFKHMRSMAKRQVMVEKKPGGAAAVR
jgi:hypothetical protein